MFFVPWCVWVCVWVCVLMQGLSEGKGEVSLDQNKDQSVDEYISWGNFGDTFYHLWVLTEVTHGQHRLKFSRWEEIRCYLRSSHLWPPLSLLCQEQYEVVPASWGKPQPSSSKAPPSSCMQQTLWPHLVSWHDPQVEGNNKVRKQVITSQHWLHVLLRQDCALMGLRSIINVSRRIGRGNCVWTWAEKMKDKATLIHHLVGPLQAPQNLS